MQLASTVLSALSRNLLQHSFALNSEPLAALKNPSVTLSQLLAALPVAGRSSTC